MKLKRHAAAVLLTTAFASVCMPVLASPTELTLEESIRLALTNSHKVKMADASKEESAWALEEAKGNKGFSLTYTNTNARLTEPPSYIGSLDSVDPYNYFSNKLTLAVPLYTGRKVENAIEAQKLGAKVADLSLSTSKQQIKLDTTVDFYQVLQAGNLLEVAKQSVDTLTNHLHNVER
ncbi:MAG: outer rane efflux protein, partial [Firmicutes bacterium]|nr:outer rane efflux protein [Bacillota bacterium]